jgi:hypothetical protein
MGARAAWAALICVASCEGVAVNNHLIERHMLVGGADIANLIVSSDLQSESGFVSFPLVTEGKVIIHATDNPNIESGLIAGNFSGALECIVNSNRPFNLFLSGAECVLRFDDVIWKYTITNAQIVIFQFHLFARTGLPLGVWDVKRPASNIEIILNCCPNRRGSARILKTVFDDKGEAVLITDLDIPDGHCADCEPRALINLKSFAQGGICFPQYERTNYSPDEETRGPNNKPFREANNWVTLPKPPPWLKAILLVAAITCLFLGFVTLPNAQPVSPSHNRLSLALYLIGVNINGCRVLLII